MTLSLGGPGVACSRMTLRRLAAGELAPEAAARAAAHLAGCARCQAAAREQEAERRALEAALPFEAFAAGVAERLATAPAGGRPPSAWRRAAPLALAAALAVGLAAPLVGRLAGQGTGLGPEATGLGPEATATRLKGAAAATLHLREGTGSRALAPGEAVPRGGALRLAISPAGRRFAAAALLDEDGPALLQAGPAGAAPGAAFEWTGRRGAVVVVLDDAPVDARALLERLARGGAAAAAPGPDAEVLVLPLRREGP